MAHLTGHGVHDTTRPAQTDRPTVLRRFVGRWVGWGIFLILIASALRMGVTRQAFWTLTRQDVDPLVIGVIVIYFLGGLLLISQGQLAVLRARWTIDRLPTGASILRNWPIYTAVVLVVLGSWPCFAAWATRCSSRVSWVRCSTPPTRCVADLPGNQPAAHPAVLAVAARARTPPPPHAGTALWRQPRCRPPWWRFRRGSAAPFLGDHSFDPGGGCLFLFQRQRDQSAVAALAA